MLDNIVGPLESPLEAGEELCNSVSPASSLIPGELTLTEAPCVVRSHERFEGSSVELLNTTITTELSMSKDTGTKISTMATEETLLLRTTTTKGEGIDLVKWEGDLKAAHMPRRMDFYHPGRLISTYSGKNDELDGRSLVVLSVTRMGFVMCLALSQHPDHTGDEAPSFYSYHAAVYSQGTPLALLSSNESLRNNPANPPIELELNGDGKFKLDEYCYLNFESTFTLRPEFPVMDLGKVRKDQRRSLMEAYQKRQVDMLNRNIEEYRLGDKLRLPGYSS